MSNSILLRYRGVDSVVDHALFRNMSGFHTSDIMSTFYNQSMRNEILSILEDIGVEDEKILRYSEYETAMDIAFDYLSNNGRVPVDGELYRATLEWFSPYNYEDYYSDEEY